MDKLPRIPSPPHAVFREFRIAALPFVVFTMVLGLTIFTWRQYVGPSYLVGEVESVRALITSTQPGRIVQLNVDVLQRVTAGEPLAVILPDDPRALAAQLGLSRARLDFLREGLDARLRQQNNQISYLQLRLDFLSQRAELASLRAQQAYFRSELDRQEILTGWFIQQEELATKNAGPERLMSSDPADVTRPLVPEFPKDLVTPNSPTNREPELADRVNRVAEYQVAKRDYDSLTAQIEERARLVSELEQALKHLEPEDAKLGQEIPAAIRTALDFEEKELRLLESQVGPVVLKATMDGSVSTIYRRVGENVPPGEPILALSGQHSDRIIAFLRQPLNMEVHTNMTLEVRSRAQHRDVGLGRVLAVGTQLEPILPQLLPRGVNSNAVEYGLPILVSLPPGLRVFSGEVVELNPVSD